MIIAIAILRPLEREGAVTQMRGDQEDFLIIFNKKLAELP